MSLKSPNELEREMRALKASRDNEIRRRSQLEQKVRNLLSALDELKSAIRYE